MEDRMARRLVILFAGFALYGCDVGGVAWSPNTDAGIWGPEDKRDTTGDKPPLIVNLDVPRSADANPTSCMEIDGSTFCVSTSCGNGILEGTEGCDDGNTVAGEGCTSDCKIEADWACPTPGSKCISTVVCGDGKVTGKETCDDRNTIDNDGCSADCGTIGIGWTCQTPGVRCQPKCGDGLMTGWEECDDANPLAGDGCGETCKVEAGSACPKPGEPCHKTVCGDGKQEGAESCDDGNTRPSDGCTVDCRAEPKCIGTDGCTSPCGDALKLPEEQCDDGNQRSGDGCDESCKLETGWTCEDVVETTVSVPIYYRDMISQAADITDPPPHPNFEVPTPSPGSAVVTGIVKELLGEDRTPQYNPDVDTAESRTTNAEDFASWYHDSKYSNVVIDTLALTQQADGTFVYDRSGVWNRAAGTWTTPAFFPLDDKGWATPPNGPEIPFLGVATRTDNAKHNFGFTSEVRYWFEYQGGEKLDFTGDDDVWVFVNGRLAVDLGGVHTASSGSITLDAAAAELYKLTVGKIYEIVVFQAERRVTDSGYKLTLGKFNRTRTLCTPRCGDGVINGAESCDDGPANSDTTYGGCTTKCTHGPSCGDGTVNTAHGEECDDGANLAKYGQATGCAPGCKPPRYCGDSRVDSLFGEECDNGPLNGQSLCSTICKAIVP
jgi:fibro-slime domain-containing protein